MHTYILVLSTAFPVKPLTGDTGFFQNVMLRSEHWSGLEYSVAVLFHRDINFLRYFPVLVVLSVVWAF